MPWIFDYIWDKVILYRFQFLEWPRHLRVTCSYRSTSYWDRTVPRFRLGLRAPPWPCTHRHTWFLSRHTCSVPVRGCRHASGLRLSPGPWSYWGSSRTTMTHAAYYWSVCKDGFLMGSIHLNRKLGMLKKKGRFLTSWNHNKLNMIFILGTQALICRGRV